MSGTFDSRCADNLYESADETTAETRWWIVAFVVCLIVLFTNTAFGNGPQIVRVEEDWVVQIVSPDASASSPQIITAMSSTNQLADVHALFELNHRTLPQFTVGGMDLQLWSGDVNLSYSAGPKTGPLSHANETVTYTMRMSLTGGNVVFEVLNGNSTTWGTFGGQGYLKTSAATAQSSLSLYSPAFSVANSRVGFAKHRVKKFALKETRYYTHDNQLVTVDQTERVVHQLPSGE